MRRALLVILVAFTAACDGWYRLTSVYPDEYERIDPPAEYLTWWYDVQRDLGWPHRIAMNHVRFYFSPDPWPRPDGGDTWGGGAGSRVFIWRPKADCRNLVKHEMLHVLLRGDRDHTHPLFAESSEYKPPWCPDRSLIW